MHMSRRPINLTEIKVAKGIDLVLQSYPYYPYRMAFQDSEFRHKLALYVLKRIDTIYIAIAPDQLDRIRGIVNQAASNQQQQIKSFIHDGISYLLPQQTIRLLEYPSFDTVEKQALESQDRPLCSKCTPISRIKLITDIELTEAGA